jgi:hypothetical protein
MAININLLQLNYPKDVIMLRGNHESRAMTEHFTFRNEVLSKYKEEQIYDLFIECFESMPLAAIVNMTISACMEVFRLA